VCADQPEAKEVLNATEPEDIEGYFLVWDLPLLAIPEGRVTLLGDVWHPMAPFPRARAGTMRCKMR
jgi:hypothetical protein